MPKPDVAAAQGHRITHATATANWQMTFSPFIDPAGMLGFLLLTSPESVGFLDGKEAFQ